MKKNIIIFVLGMLIMGGVSYAADLLADAKSISYSSEYTEKDNVSDALTELLAGGNSYEAIHKEKPTLTIFSGNGQWCLENSPYTPCNTFPSFGYKYISVTAAGSHSSGTSGTVYFNGASVGSISYSTSLVTRKVKLTDDDTQNGEVKVCINGSSSWPSWVSNITYSME